MLAQDLIQGALRLIGQTGHGRTQGAAQLADGLTALNLLIDGWNAEDLMLYTTGRAVYSLTPGKQTYTLGPSGADWTAARPQALDAAGLILTNVTPAYEQPLRILTELEWARTRIKALASSLPLEIYFESDYPNAQVSLWPVPSSAYQVALYTVQFLSAFASLSDTVSMAPGYADALRYQLAVRLAPEFGVEPPAVVLAQAEQLKRALKQQNFTIEPSRVDRELQPRGADPDYAALWGGNW